MKKLICLVCCLSMVALLFTSCFGTEVKTMEEIASGMKAVSDDYTISTFKTLSIDSDEVYVSYASYGYLMVFANEEDMEINVYNAKTGTFVFDMEVEEDTLENFYCCGVGDEIYIVVVTDDDGLYTELYSSSGNFICKKSGEIEISEMGFDLFSFGGAIYRAEKGSATLVLDNPFLTELPDISAETDSYYYSFMGRKINVYNKNLELVFHKEIPGDEYNAVLLSGDKILVQWIDYLPDTIKDYDCVYDGEKIKLNSAMLNVATSEQKDLKLDFVVSGSLLRVDEKSDTVKYSYEDITDVVAIYEIEDKMLYDNTTPKIVAIDNEKAKIQFEIFGADSNCLDIRVLENGSYIMTCVDGSEYLLTKNLKNVGKFDYYSNSSNMTNAYIVKNGALYNYNLQKVYDYSAAGYSVYAKLDNAVLFTSYDSEDNQYNYYLYNKSGTLVEITGSVVMTTNNAYVVKNTNSNGTTSYRVYTEDGSSVGSKMDGTNISLAANYNGGFVLQVWNSGEYKYYDFSK